MSHRKRPGLVVGLLFVALASAASGASASDSDLSPAEDNPPGCTTATSEDNDGCGAQGRDHFGQADHRPPIDACADSVAPSGSRITRIVPDGPRREDGSLAFVSGACVYLPPGYETSGLRYPVVHVLHGGGGDEADWVTFGDIRGVLDRAAGADPSRAVVAVMADGRSGQWYDYEDQRFLIETYVLEHLVPYVDRHFRTIPDRTGRAIVGLSNGGYGALHLAAKRPDLFVAAGGMSSNLGARGFTGLGEDGAVHYQGSVPYRLAENYDEVDLILDVATHCTSPDPFCATIAVDLAFLPDHVAFEERMDDVGHKGELDVRYADGAHQFTWWTPWLEERQLPFLQERLADPTAGREPRSRVPEELRYRTIAPEFSVWGYDVAVERDVREFLDLRKVTAGGFDVQGSGRAHIVTAAWYRPRQHYTITGATDGAPTTAVADRDGRLSVDVDLGPSHTHDQFTNDADIAEAAGGYWAVRTVTITPASSAASAADVPPPPVPLATGAAPRAERTTGTTPANEERSPTAGAATGDGGAREVELIAAPRPEIEVDPQVVPTVLFAVLLAAGPTFLWWRRRARTAEEAS